jgi:hypothetical protein
MVREPGLTFTGAGLKAEAAFLDRWFQKPAGSTLKIFFSAEIIEPITRTGFVVGRFKRLNEPAFVLTSKRDVTAANRSFSLALESTSDQPRATVTVPNPSSKLFDISIVLTADAEGAQVTLSANSTSDKTTLGEKLSSPETRFALVGQSIDRVSDQVVRYFNLNVAQTCP